MNSIDRLGGSGSREAASVRTRRRLLQAAGAMLPAAAFMTAVGSAYGFSRQEMPAELAKLYRDRCGGDQLHAATLEAAFAHLDAAGVKYDRAEVAATLRCPICGCSIISGPPARDPPSRDRPAF